MATCKWHSLDQITSYIRDTGGIEYLHGRIYESSHKLFKNDNKLTSNRHSSTMDETMRKQRHSEVLNAEVDFSIPRKKMKESQSRLQAVNSDGGIIVQHGSKTCLLKLERAQKVVYGKQYAGDRSNITLNVMELSKIQKEDGLQYLINLLPEYFDY